MFSTVFLSVIYGFELYIKCSYKVKPLLCPQKGDKPLKMS